jgi:hypothetical protein
MWKCEKSLLTSKKIQVSCFFTLEATKLVLGAIRALAQETMDLVEEHRYFPCIKTTNRGYTL